MDHARPSLNYEDTTVFKVWDPKGEMFEVTPRKARELIDLGWTPWPPEKEITQYDLFRSSNPEQIRSSTEHP